MSVIVEAAKKAHRNSTSTQPVKKPSEKTYPEAYIGIGHTTRSIKVKVMLAMTMNLVLRKKIAMKTAKKLRLVIQVVHTLLQNQPRTRYGGWCSRKLTTVNLRLL